jgi:hypothetical protein
MVSIEGVDVIYFIPGKMGAGKTIGPVLRSLGRVTV